MHLDLFQRIQVDPCSLTVIRYTTLRPFVVRLNDIGGASTDLLAAEAAEPARAASSDAAVGGGAGRVALSVGAMAGQLLDFDPPERFVAGTVGEPGERTFYLQASDGARIVSVALEKQQVAVLAERLDELLDEVRRRQAQTRPSRRRHHRSSRTSRRSARRSRRSSGSARWRWLGTRTSGTVLIEAQSVVLDESGQPLADPEVSDSAEFTGDMLRVRLNPGAGARVRQARAASRRGRTSAVPAVRQPARPARSHLPAPERPPRSTLIR